MPTFRVELNDGRAFNVEADRQPTEQEVLAFAQEGATPPSEPQDRPIGLPLAIRGIGGGLASLIGSVPSVPTTGTAVVLGAGTEALAELAEGREKLSPGSIISEGLIAGVPFGRTASLGKNVAKTAAKLGAAEAAGVQVRSMIDTGEPASVGETVTAGAIGAGVGAAGGAADALLAARAARKGIGAGISRSGGEIAAAATEAQEKVAKEAMYLHTPFDAAGDVKVNGPALTTGVTEEAGEAVNQAFRNEGKRAIELLEAQDPDTQKMRLYRRMAKTFEDGLIDAPRLAEDMYAEGMNVMEFMRFYKLSVQRGARLMSQLSKTAKHLKKRGIISEEQAEELAAAGSQSRVLEWWNKLDDTTRGLMVSQIKTGTRNFVTQGAAAATDLVEVMMTGGRQAVRDHLEAYMRAINSRRAQAEVDQLLKDRLDLRAQLRGLEWRPPGFVDDVPILRATIGKFTEATTFINRWQEMWFRSAKFQGAVRSRLRQYGLDEVAIKEAIANPKTIPDEVLDHATESALLLTFAHPSPMGEYSGEMIRAMRTLWPITTHVAPFPRYMTNAATYALRHNPLGALRLANLGFKGSRRRVTGELADSIFAAERAKLGPQASAELIESARARAGKMASKAYRKKVVAESTAGTLLMGAAVGLRYSPAAGPKWYLYRTGRQDEEGKDVMIDIRGFAGHLAPYLFFADAVHQKIETGEVRYTNKELVEGILSMNRLAGTMSTLLDWMNAQVSEKDMKGENPEAISRGLSAISTVAGQWLGRFSVPGRVVKDAMASLGDEESSYYRDVREYPLTGPFRQNVPGLDRQLPVATSILSGEPLKSEHPFLSMLTGANLRGYDVLDKELNRLGLPLRDLGWHTGVPKIDRELSWRTGRLIASEIKDILGSKAYRSASDAEQIIAIKALYREKRKVAKEDLQRTNPQLWQVLHERSRLTADQRRLDMESGFDPIAYLNQAAAKAPDTVPPPQGEEP